MKDNVTRFVVLSRDPLVATDALASSVPYKTSIVFSLQEVGRQPTRTAAQPCAARDAGCRGGPACAGSGRVALPDPALMPAPQYLAIPPATYLAAPHPPSCTFRVPACCSRR